MTGRIVDLVRGGLGRLALLGLLLSVGAAACDEKTGEFYLPAELGQPLNGAIEGRVVDSEGEGLSNVTLTRSDGTTQTTTTDGQGNYAFSNVVPGTHTVTITPPQDRTCTPGSRTVVVTSGGTAQADFTCVQTPGSITGTVLTDGGSPILGASVSLSGNGITRSTTSAGDGTFSFMDLPPGQYTLTTTATGRTCGEQTATVASGQATTVSITCQAVPGSITGTVRVDGSGVSGVDVTLTQGGQTVAGPVATASDGTYSFTGLDPGTYMVAIVPPSGTTCDPETKTASVQAGQATTVDFDCATQTGSQIPSLSEIQGNWQGTRMLVGQTGSCTPPLSQSWSGSMTASGNDLIVNGADPDVTIVGPYDAMTGAFMGNGSQDVGGGFTIDTDMDADFSFQGNTPAMADQMVRVHRSGGSEVCRETYMLAGTRTAASSARFKRDVAPVLPGEWTILGLRPVTFRYRAPYGDPDRVWVGLLAEDVFEAYPEAVQIGADGRPVGVSYGTLAGSLIDAAGAAVREAVGSVVEAAAGTVPAP